MIWTWSRQENREELGPPSETPVTLLLQKLKNVTNHTFWHNAYIFLKKLLTFFIICLLLVFLSKAILLGVLGKEHKISESASRVFLSA